MKKYYTSQSRGKILIADMDYNHIVNAMRFLERTVYYALRTDPVDEHDMYIQKTGADTKEYKALKAELKKRDPKDRWNSNSDYIIQPNLIKGE